MKSRPSPCSGGGRIVCEVFGGAGEEQSSAVPRQRDWGQRIPVVRLPLMPSSNHAAAKSRAQLIRNSRYESQFMPNKLLPTYRSRQFLIGRLRHKLTRV